MRQSIEKIWPNRNKKIKNYIERKLEQSATSVIREMEDKLELTIKSGGPDEITDYTVTLYDYLKTLIELDYTTNVDWVQYYTEQTKEYIYASQISYFISFDSDGIDLGDRFNGSSSGDWQSEELQDQVIEIAGTLLDSLYNFYYIEYLDNTHRMIFDNIQGREPEESEQTKQDMFYFNEFHYV